jgi:acyl-CoA dehydrogenase family protein 9
MESVTYLTAGIVDSYEQPDVGLEAALTKIFCTETLQKCVNQCLGIMAMHGQANLPKLSQKYLLDINQLNNLLNTNDMLRLYVSTNGLVLAGVEYGDSVRMMRNPLMHFGYFVKQIVISHR